MRAFLFILVIAALSACEKKTQGDPPPGAPSTAAARDTPSPAPKRDAAPATVDGAAELRRLAAAGQRIMVYETGQDAPASEFTVDSAGNPAAWAGVYEFGDSEWESTLTLKVEGSAASAVLSYGVLENDTTWVEHAERIEDVTISGTTLTARGWSGVFARWQGRPGLIIVRAPDDISIDPVEFGKKTEVSPDDEAP